MQQPTVGRIVHYQSYGSPMGEYTSLPRAAIITEVHYIQGSENPIVGLAVLNPEGMFFNRNVTYSEDHKPGTWSWPPRV